METAFAEKSTYIPPLILGSLLIFRAIAAGIMINHPVLQPFTGTVSVVADTLMYNLTSLMNTTQENSLVSYKDTFAMVMYPLQYMVSRVLFQFRNLYAILLSSVHFHIHTVRRQTYAFATTMFNTLQANIDRTTSLYMRLQNFLYPPQKSFYDYTTIGLVILSSFTVIAFTVYYFSKTRTKTVYQPTDSQTRTSQPMLSQKNPIRRKTKVT